MTRTPSGTAFRTPTERRQERCPDQTRPDQSPLLGLLVVVGGAESIHRYGSRGARRDAWMGRCAARFEAAS